ncbi:MAG: arylsulfatase [Verrucomicrobia bacterium]|nr:arylsulfatase [Verrucomicrobiota bacterium]
MAIPAMTSLRAAAERPNVVLILTDDQGYGDLSSSGNPYLRTPNLDRLRAESTDFSRCIAAPGGAATRAELLSGKHEFRCGISHSTAGRNLIRREVPLLSDVLVSAGYRTAIIGTWDLGEAYPCRPEDRSFQDVFVHGGGGIGQTPDRWGNAYVDPWIRRKSGWEATQGYCTQVFVAEAKRWLAARAEDQQPFFLYLALNVPHAPYEAPAGTAKRFLQAGLKEPSASFYAMIEDLDTKVGDLLAELERLQLAAATIVVFLGDNGSACGIWNAGMRGTKGSPDDGGVRVPACIRWPEKIAPKRVVTSLTSPLDLFPTLVRLCGVALPADSSGDGLDLSAALLGKAEFPTGRILFTHVGQWPGDDPPERHRSQGFAVRDQRWLLSGLELFDMAADPGQQTNVFEQHTADAARLLGAYGTWWNSIRATVREPVRYIIGDFHQPVVRLTAADWWPSREVNGAASAASLSTQAAIRRTLTTLAAGGVVAETSGHWKLRAASAGHYRITLAPLPAEASEEERAKIGQLKAGTVHLRTGKREVRMDLLKGASAVTLRLDLAVGELDLEAWFTGQLPAGRILGTCFAEIERLGERKRPEIELDFRTIPKK